MIALHRSALAVVRLPLPAILLTAACSTGDASQASVTVTDTDSLISVRVESLTGRDVPQWSTTEVFNTSSIPASNSSTSTGLELYQVTAARFLPDGSLAVANAGTGEVFLIGREGGAVRTLGGKGEGPGEFAWISALDVDSTGSIVAYDPRQGRLTRLTSDDQPETRAFAPPNRVVDLHPLAFLDDGRVAAIYGEMRLFATSGEKRDTTPLMIFQSDGSRPDTVTMVPATEWAFVSFDGGASRALVGFGRSAMYAGRNSRYAVGTNDSIDVTVYDGSGDAVMRVIGPGGGAVTTGDVDAWNEERLAGQAGLPESMRSAFRTVPHRPTLPGFGALAVDDHGRIWIGSYARPAQESRDWLVLGTDGRPEGRLSTPADARVLDIAGERIAVLHRDELDEEYISVLSIRND